MWHSRTGKNNLCLEKSASRYPGARGWWLEVAWRRLLGDISLPVSWFRYWFHRCFQFAAHESVQIIHFSLYAMLQQNINPPKEMKQIHSQGVNAPVKIQLSNVDLERPSVPRGTKAHAWVTSEGEDASSCFQIQGVICLMLNEVRIKWWSA